MLLLSLLVYNKDQLNSDERNLSLISQTNNQLTDICRTNSSCRTKNKFIFKHNRPGVSTHGS